MADYGKDAPLPRRKEWEDRYFNNSDRYYATCRKCGALVDKVYNGIQLHDSFHQSFEEDGK